MTDLKYSSGSLTDSDRAPAIGIQYAGTNRTYRGHDRTAPACDRTQNKVRRQEDGKGDVREAEDFSNEDGELGLVV